MPTPISAARQCLTEESAAVLDEAVAVASRRGHSQTTSLHMVSSLLSIPKSSLREACTRTRNNAYSSRVQFKALKLSIGVSLDRLPSNQVNRVEEPPVSNSLMAAIKRSQANQRRQPENFSFYQQQQYSSCSSVPVVKVELQNLVLSILDDPLVSRVFGEAGFRSSDIKMATIRPGNSFYPSHMFGCVSRYKRPNPPQFLCNLSTNSTSKGFIFPFMDSYSGDDNSRRISDVLLRGKRRSPLLIGISAGDALRDFLETVQRKTKGVLPEGPSVMDVVCIKDEIVRYLNDDCDEAPLKFRFEEVEKLVVDVGVLVSFGDLNAFVADGVSIDRLKFVMSELARLVKVFGGKLRLIGAAATYEVYFKVLKKFPTIEEDWELEVLPITSVKFSVGGSYPKSSLMESFVPLGGFFSVPPETVTPSSIACMTRCHLCNQKYEQEVAALPNEGSQSSLPSLLQSAEQGSQNIKGTDDRLLLNAKIMALRKKWDGICEQCHLNRSFSKGYNHYPCVQGESEKPSHDSSNGQGNKHTYSMKKVSSPDMLSKANNRSIVSASGDTFGLKAGHFDSFRDDNRACPTSVTTYIGLMNPDVKDLHKALTERVGHQSEAISSIVEALSRSQTWRRTTWMILRGGDRLSKKKVGVALAEILHGSKENFIYVDLSFQDDITYIDAQFDSQVVNKYDITKGGSAVDYLAEHLSKKPCVVFLDNVDKADLAIQNCLSGAAKTGRFNDMFGREVSVKNSIFLGAKNSFGEISRIEDMVSTKGGSIQLLIGFDLNDGPTREGNLFVMNKRKKSNPFLDLNLPAEGNEVSDAESGTDSGSANSRSWFEDFEKHLAQTIVFEEFDFETIGEKIMKNVVDCFHEVVGSECSIEIEQKVVQRLQAAAYLFGIKRVDDWIQNVVSEVFLEARREFSLNVGSIIKLVVCEEQHEELLPARITIK